MSSAPNILEKFPAESILFDLDCTDDLADGETITGTITMSFLPATLSGGDALTFAAAVANSSTVTYPDGRQALAGKAVQVRISGGSVATGEASRLYTVLASFGTTQSNTLVASGRLAVLDPALA